MELRGLHSFIAVAEERNFTKAAWRVQISQPPVSRHNRDLENELRAIESRSGRGNCPGFVGNRFMFPYMDEAQFRVEEGATTEQVDKALRGLDGYALRASDGDVIYTNGMAFLRGAAGRCFRETQ